MWAGVREAFFCLSHDADHLKSRRSSRQQRTCSMMRSWLEHMMRYPCEPHPQPLRCTLYKLSNKYLQQSGCCGGRTSHCHTPRVVIAISAENGFITATMTYDIVFHSIPGYRFDSISIQYTSHYYKAVYEYCWTSTYTVAVRVLD